MARVDKSSIIVSADKSIVNLMTDVLLQYDYTVTIEKSILKLISSLLEKEITLLILDMDSPPGINFDSIDIIRKLCPRLPIVILSADSSLETLKILAQKGVFYSAIKPLQAEEIEEVISAAAQAYHRNNNKNEKLLYHQV